MPSMDGKNAEGATNMYGVGDDSGAINGSSDTSLAPRSAQQTLAKPPSMNDTAMRPPVINEVTNFLDQSDDEGGDMQIQLVTKAALAASKKNSLDQKQIKCFLDNSDSEDDELERTRAKVTTPSSSVQTTPLNPYSFTRLKSITHAEASNHSSELDTADTGFIPSAPVLRTKSLRPPGMRASYKQPSFLKLNQFNEEAGQTLFHNLFRDWCVANEIFLKFNSANL